MERSQPPSSSGPQWWITPRWRLLALYLGFQAVVAYFLGMVLIAVTFNEDHHLLLTAGSLGFVAIFFTLQLLFIRPIRRPGLGTRGVPILVSLAIGGLLAAGLVTAAFCTVTQLGDVYIKGFGVPAWSPLAVMGGAWLVSTPLIVAFCRRGRRDDRLQGLAAGLFLGTIIEAAAIIPLDALVRRREDCMCGTGTFFALIVCCAIGLFLVGPAIILPLVSARRRRWADQHCDVCGYDMRGRRGADVCPECGTGWRKARD